MEKTSKVSADNSEEICVVCCRPYSFFAVGVCDHPVCHECSTRMRVLCRQSECPICRQELSKVYFTKKRAEFSKLLKCNFTLSCKDIIFEDEGVHMAYLKLLEHCCSQCKNGIQYRNFTALRDHVRKIHELFYCDLCIDNLKIFTFERKCYTREELAKHRRVGDADDTSHRGHPLCVYCDERFLDNDELFRHLRRNHFFCHFCDADGLHQYYNDYEYLREHFRQEHFLCEEGKCREESFTTAFRTEIDFKAHVATVHNRNLSKAQAKQARTLELKFTITPRNTANGMGPSVGLTEVDSSTNEGRRNRMHHHERENSSSNTANLSSMDEGAIGGIQGPFQRMNVQEIDMNCNIEFPSLKNGGQLPNSAKGQANASSQPASSGSTLANRLLKINRFTVNNTVGNDDFPELPNFGNLPNSSSKSGNLPKANNAVVANKLPKGTVTSTGRASVKVSSSVPAADSSTNNLKKRITLSINSQEDFPSLGKDTNRGPSNLSIQLSSSDNRDSGKESTSHTIPPGTIPVVTRASSSQNITLLSPVRNINVLSSFENENSKMKQNPTWVGTNQKPKNEHVNSEIKKPADFLPGKLNENFPSLEQKGKPSSSKHFVHNENKSKKALSVTVPIKNSSWNSNVATASPSNANNSENKIAEQNEVGQKKLKSKKNKDNKISPNNGSNDSEAVVTVDSKKKTKQVISNKSGELKQSTLEIGPVISRTNQLESSSALNKNTPTKVNNKSSVVFKAEDFPDLISKSQAKMNSAPPGFGTSNASSAKSFPPGFTISDSTKSAAPPGFSMNLDSASLAPDVMFTNSSGENFALISPGSFSTHYKYKYPSDFQQRSCKLTENIKSLLNENEDKFQEFRHISGRFRQNIISAREYIDLCNELLGSEKFFHVFPELLVLLPDIRKQQELLSVQNLIQKQKLKSSYLICNTCQQIVACDDFHPHVALHTFNESFPSL